VDGGGVGGVAYSEDSGITWRLTETEPPSGSAALEIHPERGILAGGGSLWQSTDLGRIWRSFGDPREFEYHRCTDLLFDGGRLLSGTDDGGVFITEFPPLLRQTVVRSDE